MRRRQCNLVAGMVAAFHGVSMPDSFCLGSRPSATAIGCHFSEV
jgi:hypothetical protein